MALSDYFKFWNAKDATGVAADLDTGKTMYNDSGKITGTKVYSDYFPLPKIGNIQLQAENPVGGSASGWQPKLAYPTGALLISNPAWTLLGASSWELGTDGLAYSTGAYSDYIRSADDGPAIPATGRRFDIWGKLLATTNAGCFLYFNIADVSTDWWGVSLSWNASVNAWRFYIAERTASVTTTRAGPFDFATAITQPAWFRLTGISYGDTIAGFARVWEFGSATDIDAEPLIYNVASRANKTATGFKFSGGPATTGESKIHGCSVVDLV